MGHGPIDIALWDWAGKHYGASIAELLGGYRKRLPAYASTYHGDRAGGLASKEAFADFAEQCHALGYRAFKMHGWNDGNAREEAENVLHVARQVGDRMTLMLDPACELRTFADALYVGRACDEANYFWYEDPFRDGGTSAFAHKRLRELIRTPLLMTEHVRGVEPKADFVLAGGTDFLRVDPEYDMGITGSLKIAHLAEALGLDVEIHACGPAHRHLHGGDAQHQLLRGGAGRSGLPERRASRLRLRLLATSSTASTPTARVPVPTGPGLGVTYDWDFIARHRVKRHVFE